jgi:hypothetical protein
MGWTWVKEEGRLWLQAKKIWDVVKRTMVAVELATIQKYPQRRVVNKLEYFVHKYQLKYTRVRSSKQHESTGKRPSHVTSHSPQSLE